MVRVTAHHGTTTARQRRGAFAVDEHSRPADVVVDDDALAAAMERELARAQSGRRAVQRRRATWVHMVASLLVVLAVVAALMLLVPRTNSITQPPVDVAAGARAAATQVEFTPSVPSGLPAGWRATSVRTTRSTANVMTWHAGYMTSDDQYAAVEQGQDAPAEWIRSQTNRGREEGTVDVEGEPWRRFVRLDKVQHSLVHQRGDVTTIVTGTASFEDLALLAASLQPQG
jgi:hypothetical protein